MHIICKLQLCNLCPILKHCVSNCHVTHQSWHFPGESSIDVESGGSFLSEWFQPGWLKVDHIDQKKFCVGFHTA